jgi:hypothetical protein
MEKIASKGFLVKHKMRKKPGEVLMKKVAAGVSAAKRSKTGGEVKRGEKTIPPRR